ncbi:hypothetical protein CYLTODRAFT_269856 [Cylindrobasidium torrendii FP15055 ss-10]|uniref:Uncharacterized protein n=1 Tax=Cylindrobasidium torrendii FP15055 ss-10 TaxID=1314674 RepID=A0A0D7BS20_9AGAR|nr:hypothetical protein CYLTODRAFT_269856 [Cylindrobasidium torrendii FP15055 ss-10]
MDHNDNTYIAITLAAGSALHSSPDTISTVYPSLAYNGKVGALDTVHLVSVPKSTWNQDKPEIMERLKRAEGVQSVDVQKPRQRQKRDEF